MNSIKTKPLHLVVIASKNGDFVETIRKKINECIDISKKEKGVNPVMMVSYGMNLVYSDDCRHCIFNVGDHKCSSDAVKKRYVNVRVECSERDRFDDDDDCDIMVDGIGGRVLLEGNTAKEDS